MTGDYPRFSPDEFARRRRLLFAVAGEAGLDAILVYGADRSGSAVQWVTGWPVTREAVVLMQPDRPDLMWVQFYNHVPNAARLAPETQVIWGGPSTFATVADTLAARGIARLGTIGPLRHTDHQRLEAGLVDVVSLDSTYTRLRMRKSAEEIGWLRTGADLSDRAVVALRDGLRPGLNEYDLGALVEGAYVPVGGTTHIHYFGVTSMSEPRSFVPSQWPSTRQVRPGDILTTEISASWWGYPGQVLRTMTVGVESTARYRALHEVADAAYNALVDRIQPGLHVSELVDAASLIDDAGYTICDDLVHGFGGGYLPPVLGTRSRPAGPIPDLVLEEGMALVVQPNVITPDERAGVQTGGLVLVTAHGCEELQRAPRGLWQTG
ncbi:MAG: M24 family metallopeptidase [Acidimicrobiia bacterium]